MKVSCALATTGLSLLSLMAARAGTIYPTQPCRVYDDTAFIQIPGAGRSWHFTRAGYSCGLQGSRGIITAHSTSRQ